MGEGLSLVARKLREAGPEHVWWGLPGVEEQGWLSHACRRWDSALIQNAQAQARSLAEYVLTA